MVAWCEVQEDQTVCFAVMQYSRGKVENDRSRDMALASRFSSSRRKETEVMTPQTSELHSTAGKPIDEVGGMFCYNPM